MNALVSEIVLERPAFVPGVFEDMPAETYHAIEAMSASGAKKILRAPALYKLMRDQGSEATDSMNVGTAVHYGVLQPHLLPLRVCCAPEVNKRTNAGKEEYAAFEAANADKTILSVSDYEDAMRCVDAVNAHPMARHLLDGSRREVSIFWYDGRYGVPCKCRYDILNHGGGIDLKKTKDASPDGFGREAAKYLYHVQAAHYWSGHEHALDGSPKFFAFIAVEPERPNLVACYTMPTDALLAGAHLMNTALERYAAALESGKWGGYPEEIHALRFPRYALSVNP